MKADLDKDGKTIDEHEHMTTKPSIQEAVLELLENDSGQIVLRDANSHDDALVTIDFSDKIQDMLGEDAQSIGQHMIHAAIQAVMHKQISRWHANVYDEEPEHYS